MKIFISADIEGTAFTTYWDETELKEGVYARAALEMTREVRAAVGGAVAAGADEIVVNDAHDFGINIDPNEMPECVELIRGWSGSPLSMVEGIDESFDAAMFVGWHAAAGRYGNPLSHTMSTKTTKVTLNGLPCSEFVLYSWACAMNGVPTVFLAGDQALIDDSAPSAAENGGGEERLGRLYALSFSAEGPAADPGRERSCAQAGSQQRLHSASRAF